MRGKKILAAKILNNTGLFGLISKPKRLHVLCYHRIARNNDTIKNCRFDRGAYTCTTQTFTAQLHWLKQSTNIISLEQLLQMRNGKDIGKGPYSLVTFDDAYLDCFTEANPVLIKLEIPALVFVPSKLIDEGKVGWWDMLSYIFRNAQTRKFMWEGNTYHPKERFGITFNYFLDRMKNDPAHSNETLIQDLAQACQVDLPSNQEQASQMMNWEQIKEISEGVFEIGSHTHTHRVLTTLRPDEQYQELCFSKNLIEQKVGNPVRSLAYPVGGDKRFDSVTKKAVKQCGYDLAFSFNTGYTSDIKSLNPYEVCRFEPAKEIALLAGQCALPGLLL
jgi:peptidoglycan/xylan/chitin deacetylase (PgdA/CDA1 family)